MGADGACAEAGGACAEAGGACAEAGGACAEAGGTCGVSRGPSPAVTAQISSPRLDGGSAPIRWRPAKVPETTCQGRTICAHQGVCDITFQTYVQQVFE